MVKRLVREVKKAAVAWTVWYVACAACAEQPRLYLSPQADSAISRMFVSASRARAERMDCLVYRNDSIVSADPLGMQIVTRYGDGVQGQQGACPDGNVHAHIFPDSLGGIDSLFSRGDESQHRPGLTYCIAYSSDRMRCKTPSWEGVVKYGLRR
jgi:hypothetical protein